MDTKVFFKERFLAGVIVATIALLVILFSFKAGTMVGVRQANFSCRWSDNYHSNFGGPREGFLGGFGDRDFLESNGTFGQIIKLSDSSLVISGRGSAEKVIILDAQTTIRSRKDNIKIFDLKINDNVVVIGEPNELGQIVAKLVRLMPQPVPGGLPRLNLSSTSTPPVFNQ